MSRSKGLVSTERSYHKKYSKNYTKLQGQGHKAKNYGNTERSCYKEYSYEI